MLLLVNLQKKQLNFYPAIFIWYFPSLPEQCLSRVCLCTPVTCDLCCQSESRRGPPPGRQSTWWWCCRCCSPAGPSPAPQCCSWPRPRPAWRSSSRGDWWSSLRASKPLASVTMIWKVEILITYDKYTIWLLCFRSDGHLQMFCTFWVKFIRSFVQLNSWPWYVVKV